MLRIEELARKIGHFEKSDIGVEIALTYGFLKIKTSLSSAEMAWKQMHIEQEKLRKYFSTQRIKRFSAFEFSGRNRLFFSIWIGINHLGAFTTQRDQ